MRSNVRQMFVSAPCDVSGWINGRQQIGHYSLQKGAGRFHLLVLSRPWWSMATVQVALTVALRYADSRMCVGPTGLPSSQLLPSATSAEER